MSGWSTPSRLTRAIHLALGERAVDLLHKVFNALASRVAGQCLTGAKSDADRLCHIASGRECQRVSARRHTRDRVLTIGIRIIVFFGLTGSDVDFRTRNSYAAEFDTVPVIVAVVTGGA